MATPQAAKSVWVRREFEYWFGHRDKAKALIVLSDGVIAWDPVANEVDWSRTDALPPMPPGTFPSEPLWVDMTWLRKGDRIDPRDPRFEQAVARIAAPLHGRDLDEIFGEHLRLRRSARRRLWGTVAALSVLLVAAVVFAFGFYRQRNEAILKSRIATSRQLAAQGREVIGRHLDRAALLGVSALESYPTYEATSLLAAVSRARPGLIGFLPFRGGAVDRVAVSGDGRTLAAGFDAATDRGGVALWDPETRRPGPILDVTEGRVTGLALSRDGRALAAAFRSGVVLWEIVPRERSSTTAQPKARAGARVVLKVDEGEVRDLVLSKDGNTLAVGYAKPGRGGVVLWDVAARTRIGQALEVPEGPVAGVALDASVNTVAAVYVSSRGLGIDRSGVIVFDRSKGTQPDLTRREMPVSPVTGNPILVALSPDGSTLATGVVPVPVFGEPASSGQIAVFDLKNPRESEPTVLSVSEGPLRCLAVSPDGAALAAGFALTTGGAFRSGVALWDLRYKNRKDPPLDVSEGVVSSLAFDGNQALAIAYGGGVALWDLSARTAQGRTVEVPRGAVRGIAFAPDGRTLAVGHGTAPPVAPMFFGHGPETRGGVLLVDPATRATKGSELDVPEGDVCGISVAPNGATLAAGFTEFGQSRRSGVVLWDLPSAQRRGAPLEFDVGDGKTVTGVALSPDGRTLAAGSKLLIDFATDKGGVAFWDLRTRARRDVTEAGSVIAIAFSPDGSTLAAATKGGIGLWDASNARRRGPSLPVAEGRVTCLAFDRDGGRLAAGFDSSGNTVDLRGGVVLWGTGTWQCAGSALEVVGRAVQAVAFHPSDNILAAGLKDPDAYREFDRGGLALWDLRSGAPLASVLEIEGGFVTSVAYDPAGEALAAGFKNHGPEGPQFGGVAFSVGSIAAWRTSARRIANRNFSRAEWREIFPGEAYRRTFPELPDGD